MTPSAPHRSLADDIRARSADQIARLIHLRPDLAQPWPADLSQLARRAGDDASVLEAMQSLDTFALRVLEVFAALHEATVEEIAARIPQAEGDVGAAVAALWDRALVWGGPTFRIVRAAQQAFGPYPCGLAAAGHSEPDADEVRQAALDVDEDELRDLVWSNPVRDQPQPLLTPRAEAYVLPREASLILREGMFLQPGPPPPEQVPAPAATGQFMWAPIAGVRYVVSELAREPLPCNAARGVSRRAVSDLADRMHVPVDDLMIWLELASLAGLVGMSDGGARATPAATAWMHAPAEQMWLTLMRAWLDADRLLTHARPEEAGCLSTTTRPRVSHHRRLVLGMLKPEVQMDAAGLAAAVAWWLPRMHEAHEQAPEFFTEASMLGLVEGTVATEALSVLLEDEQSAAGLLPGPQAHQSLVIQPDQTVMAPANIDTDTWMLLSDMACVESWGPVTMHRFDRARIGVAVSGRTADDLLDRLRHVSRTPLPQSLEYEIADAARGSTARVRRATLVEVAAADVETVSELGLTQVGPMAFASALDEQAVRQRLADAGIAADAQPVAGPVEALDYAQASPLLDTNTIGRLVAHLMGDDAKAEAPPPQLREVDPQTMADVCRQAISDARCLWLSYSDAGESVVELVEPVDLRSGRLTGWSLSGNRAVNVALSRIAAYQEQS